MKKKKKLQILHEKSLKFSKNHPKSRELGTLQKPCPTPQQDTTRGNHRSPFPGPTRSRTPLTIENKVSFDRQQRQTFSRRLRRPPYILLLFFASLFPVCRPRRRGPRRRAIQRCRPRRRGSRRRATKRRRPRRRGTGQRGTRLQAEAVQDEVAWDQAAWDQAAWDQAAWDELAWE